MIIVDYREILRLQSFGHNINQITGALHSSRNTVREVERLADEKRIRWSLGEEVTNPQFMFCFIRNVRKKQMFIWNRTAPGFTANWRKRSEPDITLKRISDQLIQCRACPIPVYTIL